ncbi:universal stress protein [Ornithinibacillus xuwenensis]|uniref:Universal stress protein n=1 Tax=Ornithinibacillus xuwenensis TaxID=3144668 RepID=A0ABU9XK87_9BACI
MKGFKKIFVAFDGSNDSVEALKKAEYMSKLSDARLTVGYVHEPSLDTTVTPGLTKDSDPNLYQSHTYVGPIPPPNIGSQINAAEPNLQDNTPDNIISEASHRLSHLVNVEYEVLYGKPANEILDFTKEKDVDLVVMGNRGISGIKKLVMGSVSKKVVDEAECPVLVVK